MSVDQAYNYVKINESISTSGLLNEEHLGSLKQENYQLVINLLPNELEYAIKNEQSLVETQGLAYHYIPVDFDRPTLADFEACEKIMLANKDKQLMLHCAANFRATAFFAIYAHRNLGWSADKCYELIASVWPLEKHPQWQRFVAQFI